MIEVGMLSTLWARVDIPNGFVLPKLLAMGLTYVLWRLRANPRALLFIAVTGLCTWYSEQPYVSFWGLPSQWSQGFLAVCFYCLLLNCKTKTNWIKWAGVALAVHCVVQPFEMDPYVPYSLLPAGRSVGWVGSPVDAGAILAMAAPVSGMFLPLIGLGILATGSRGALLGAVFALAPGRMRWLLLPVFLVPFFLQAPKDIARVEVWRAGWEGFREHKWLGYGPGLYQLALKKHRTERLDKAVGTSYNQAHAHNDIIDALCTTGVLGLVAYLILLWPLRRDPSLIALFVNLKFNPVSFEVWCCAALLAGKYYEDWNWEKKKL